ncbi:hypothetical protein [Sinomonas mesophila]|uniref:hypothetical protein n=1 Tax=Sinomonas mesophila TaxID=1531955 RepID=UPI000986D0FA|nr:hypothetical protein [Sinomonas mesophila]
MEPLSLQTDEARSLFAGLPFARQTLEALAGARLPPELTDREAVLAGLGRTPSDVPLPAGFPISL